MAKKIKVKLILELQAAQMSQREICRTRKMSQHSVGDVWRIAKELGIAYHDVSDKSFTECSIAENKFLKRCIRLQITATSTQN